MDGKTRGKTAGRAGVKATGRAGDTQPRAAAPRRGIEAARVAGLLREAIVGGRLPSGAVLRQERLAARYDTSRMPVRDALRILESQGLVTLAPNKGAVVARLDPDEFREIAEMRAALEVLALTRAIPELTETRLDAVEAIQDAAEAAELADFGKCNKAFHSALYEAAGRPRLLAQIAALNDLADRYLRVAVTTLDYRRRSHREHRALLAACRKRDVEAATACLKAHIEDAGQRLYEVLQERLGK